MPPINKAIHCSFVKDCINTFDRFCRDFAWFVNNQKNMDNDKKNQTIAYLLSVGNTVRRIHERVDFTSMTDSEKEKYIIWEYKNKIHTLADEYCPNHEKSGKRLWEMLIRYENIPKELAEITIWEYNFINKVLPETAKYAQVGKWFC